jgi:hypothetical protein
VQQLVCIYRPSVWWWAVVVLLRRLLVAAVLVLVRSSTVWIWLTLCNSLILAGHAWVRPYKRPFDNAAEMLCLLSLTLQTALLSVWPPPVNSAALLSVLLCSVALPLLPLLAAPLVSRWLARQEASAAVKRSDMLELRDDGRL